MVKEPRVNKVLARKRIDTTEEVIETMATITNQDIRLSHINFDYSVLLSEAVGISPCFSSKSAISFLIR